LPAAQISVASFLAWVAVFGFLNRDAQTRALFRLPFDNPTIAAGGIATVALVIAIVCSRRPGAWLPSLWAALLALGSGATFAALLLGGLPALSPLAHALVSAWFAAVVVLLPRLVYVRPDGRAVQWLAAIWLLLVLVCGLPAAYLEERHLVGMQVLRIDNEIARLDVQRRELAVRRPVWGKDGLEHEDDLQRVHLTPLLADPYLWKGARAVGREKLVALKQANDAVLVAVGRLVEEAKEALPCPANLVRQREPLQNPGPIIWGAEDDTPLRAAKADLRETLEDRYHALVEQTTQHRAAIQRLCSELEIPSIVPGDDADMADLKGRCAAVCTLPSFEPACDLPPPRGPRAAIPLRDLVGDFGSNEPIHAGMLWELTKLTESKARAAGCYPASHQTHELSLRFLYCNVYAAPRGARLKAMRMQVWFRDRMARLSGDDNKEPRFFITFPTEEPSWERARDVIVPLLRDEKPYQTARGARLHVEAPFCSPSACINVMGESRRLEAIANSCRNLTQPPGALCLSVKVN